MPHHFFGVLLLLVYTVFGENPRTYVDLNSIRFSSDKSFINSFPIGTTGYGMNVQCECVASTGKGDAVGHMSKVYVVQNINDNSMMIDEMSFELSNPADWLTLTCTFHLRFTSDTNGQPMETIGFIQVFSAANDDNFAPSAPPTNINAKRFTSPPEWTLTASIVKRCDGSEVLNFNCDTNCQSFMCSNSPNICCPEDADLAQCTCKSNPFTSSTTPVTPNPGSKNNEDCKDEDLYFWIMIGLACLSGLLLILLIICLSYICCALSGEDDARKAQQQQPETVRPPPPVYLSTPPRDPRYGYRGPPPLDPYGRPEAGYREEYDTDFDSLAAEWQEPSARREARV